MALVSEGRSNLNPNAPLFVPASLRQVEDFSTEWWNLVTTSTWFRDYWLSQIQEGDTFGNVEDCFDGTSVLLPDTIDLDMDDDILNMEAQFEEFLLSSEAEYGGHAVGGITEKGFSKSCDAVVKTNLPKERAPKSPREPVRHWEKPVKHVSLRCTPRSIHQPR